MPWINCKTVALKGIAKETKMICKCLRQGESITRVHWSKTIMENGWDVLEMLHDEFLCAGNGDGTAATEAGNSPRYDQRLLLIYRRTYFVYAKFTFSMDFLR